MITLEFRAFVKYGVLLYASNGKSGNEFEYLAVELNEGKIVYHFNSGPGVVRMQTNTDYAKGEWVKVCNTRQTTKNNENPSTERAAFPLAAFYFMMMCG